MIPNGNFALIAGAGLAGLVIVALWVAAITRSAHRRVLAELERRSARLEAELAAAGTSLSGHEHDRRRLQAELGAGRDTAARLESELHAVGEARLAADTARLRTAASLAAADAELTTANERRASLEAALDEAIRDLNQARGRCGDLDARLLAAVRARLSAEADRTRVTLQADTLERQLAESVAAGRDERQRLEAGRALVATRIHDLERQLAAERSARTALDEAGAASSSGRAVGEQRIAALERELKESRLAHQEELASLEAAVGAATARADRVEPLQRQVADREELLRSLAQERDAAVRLAARREQEAIELAVERDRLRTVADPAAERIAALQQRAAHSQREYEAALVRERQLNARIDSLSVELRDRDQRFRTLLEDRRAAVDAGRSVIADLREKLNRLERAKAPADRPATVAGAGTENLKRIVGIGPAIERMLQSHGITTLHQIAEWNDDDVDRIGAELGAFRDRIRRDRWVEQAREVLGWPAREVAG